MTYSTCSCGRNFLNDEFLARHQQADHTDTVKTQPSSEPQSLPQTSHVTHVEQPAQVDAQDDIIITGIDDGPITIAGVPIDDNLAAIGITYDILRNGVDQGRFERIPSDDPNHPERDHFKATICGASYGGTDFCVSPKHKRGRHRFRHPKCAAIDVDSPDYILSSDAVRVIINEAIRIRDLAKAENANLQTFITENAGT